MKDNIKKADCAVRAICNTTGAEYDTVEAALLKAGRKINRGTYPDQIRKAIITLGFQIRERRFTKGTTIASAPREFPGGAWILFVRGHFAAIVDGNVIDWSEGRRFRIKHAYHITK